MELRGWIAALTGRTELRDASMPFANLIESGVALCELVNACRPGSIEKIYRGGLAYRQMDNVFAFLQACKAEGLAQTDRFEMPDLFERRNLSAVLHTLDLLRAQYDVLAEGSSSRASAAAPVS